MIEPADVGTVEKIAEINFSPEMWNLTPAELGRIDMPAYLARMREHIKTVRTFRLPDGLVMWGRGAHPAARPGDRAGAGNSPAGDRRPLRLRLPARIRVSGRLR